MDVWVHLFTGKSTQAREKDPSREANLWRVEGHRRTLNLYRRATAESQGHLGGVE